MPMSSNCCASTGPKQLNAYLRQCCLKKLDHGVASKNHFSAQNHDNVSRSEKSAIAVRRLEIASAANNFSSAG